MRRLGRLDLMGVCIAGAACADHAGVEELVIVKGHAPALLSTVVPNDPYFSDQWQLHNEGPFTTEDGKGKINGADHAHVADAWALILDLELATSVAEIGESVRTSAAAPVVAGIVGLMLHTNPKLTSSQVRGILAASADKVYGTAAKYDDKGFSPQYGYGRANALRAVAFAHLLNGGEITDSLRGDIDERSPCTRSDCWDLEGAPGLSPGDGGGGTSNGGATNGANTGASNGATNAGANGGSVGDGDVSGQSAGAADDADSKAGGCSTSRVRSPWGALYGLLAGAALLSRRRRF